MAVFLWRTLVMLRRYLGIAVGVLMLIWFPGCAANVRFYMRRPIVWHVALGRKGNKRL